MVAPKAIALGEYDNAGFPASTVSNIKWIADSSYSASYATAYINPAPGKWNGISSKVKAVQGTATSLNVRILAGTTPDPSLAALTVPYCSAGNGEICRGGSQVWTAARIYGYESSMQAAGLTTERRIAVFTHEFGHVLSLKHVFTSSVASLMKPVLPATSTIENLDKANLRGKWGT